MICWTAGGTWGVAMQEGQILDAWILTYLN